MGVMAIGRDTPENYNPSKHLEGDPLKIPNFARLVLDLSKLFFNLVKKPIFAGLLLETEKWNHRAFSFFFVSRKRSCKFH